MLKLDYLFLCFIILTNCTKDKDIDAPQYSHSEIPEYSTNLYFPIDTTNLWVYRKDNYDIIRTPLYDDSHEYEIISTYDTFSFGSSRIINGMVAYPYLVNTHLVQYYSTSDDRIFTFDKILGANPDSFRTISYLFTNTDGTSWSCKYRDQTVRFHQKSEENKLILDYSIRYAETINKHFKKIEELCTLMVHAAVIAIR